MKILLDCDGVLSDFVAHALKEVNELHPGRYGFTPKHVVEWEVEHLLPPKLRPEFFKRLKRRYWCETIPLRKGAGVLTSLRAEGHEVEIVTTPLKGSPHWMHERVMWVRKYFGNVTVHFKHNKTTVPGDVFVDDKPSHVLDWQKAYPEGTALLMDQPYNRRAECERIFSLTDIFHYL